MEAICVDIDGVISDCTGRYDTLFRDRHLPDWEPDWETFHGPVMDMEPVHREFVTLVQLLKADAIIILLTNRAEELRARTIEYMARNGVPFDILSMRQPDEVFNNSKANRLDAFIASGINVALGIDDDPHEGRMYEQRGIPFLYVHRGHHVGQIRGSKTA